MVKVNSDGQITYFSKGAERLFGFAAAEVLDQKIFATILPEQESSGRNLKQLLQRVLSQPEQFQYIEHENVHKNGKRIWVAWRNTPVYDQSGNLQYILSIGDNITLQKKAEQTLKESELKFRQLFMQHVAAKLIIDPLRDGRIVDANRSASVFYGFSREELCTLSITDFLPADRVEIARQNLAKTLELGSNHRIQYKTFRLDGSLFDVNLFAATMYDADGSPIGFIGITQDITPFKQKEAEVKQLLHDKEQLLREVHHRIKNHMNTIYSILSLNARYYDNAEISTVFDEVRTKIRLMQSIYDTLYRGNTVLRPYAHQ